MEPKLRRSTYTDVDSLLSIEKESFEREPYDRNLFNLFLSDRKSYFIVAEVGKRVVGYAIATYKGSTAVITSMAVRAGYRGKGIGALLLEDILKEVSDKVPVVELQVAVDNKAAIALYRKYSFSEVGIVHNYYGEGKDAILMRKEF
jgi:ribosomal-protein-alanine N-acetyltransferase